MEFHSKLLQPLPFYMAYPRYCEPGQEELCLRDMEYLQQLYPDEIKRFRRRVAEILDRTDYEGSMIYDEYPDRYSVRRLAQSIHIILRDEAEDGEAPSEEMVQLLLLNEIYKRRHGGRRAGYQRLF